MDLPDLSNKTALVTGASRGIGAQTAIALAQAGAHVILTARTVGGLEEIDDKIQAAGGSATLIPLDLHDHKAIDTLGPNLYERFKSLDIFVANAGMLGTLGPLGHADHREWDKVISINLTANFRLIRTVEPLMKNAQAGRAVFLTSGVTNGMRPYWGAYAASKAGLESLAQSWAAECDDTNIRVNIFDPGRVKTGMRAQAYPGEDANKLDLPEDIARKICKLCSPDFTENGQRLAA